jgi:MOSC domain-containing protein YiiM
MRGNQQGALARVTATGRIAVGDQATVAPPQPLTVTAAP